MVPVELRRIYILATHKWKLELDTQHPYLVNTDRCLVRDSQSGEHVLDTFECVALHNRLITHVLFSYSVFVRKDDFSRSMAVFCAKQEITLSPRGSWIEFHPHSLLTILVDFIQ